MKFLCDHDVAADVARVLRARGYAVVELREVLPPDFATAGTIAPYRRKAEKAREVAVCHPLDDNTALPWKLSR